MSFDHDHHGNALTFGCAGCIERVRLDQEAATLQEELDAAPLRDVRVTFIASWSVSGEVILRTPIPERWDERDVREYFSEFDVREAPVRAASPARPLHQLDLFGAAS